MTGNLWDYYIDRAAYIAKRDNQPDTLPDAAAWRSLRPRVYGQYMTSLGLEHLPERCDLKPTVTGTFQGDGYTAQKMAYQILPDVWGSAHLYRPADRAETDPAPAVLYTCGHHTAGVEGYQHHAMAWARRGYICLIFDTIEQHDNPGDHHGLATERAPGWISMGYAGAGGEVFNGMRALDLLLAQPGVDASRVGVTGLSGGGSQSFRLAAADDRLQAVATVAGVSDPAFAIALRQVQQHCDCMYEHNRFARDVSVWAALIAPRPLLYCFARHDNLYTPEEFRSIYKHTQARYEKLGHGDLCQLEEYDGQHGYNHKSTTDAIHAWFDRHVAGQPHREVDTLAIKETGDIHDEPTLSTFHGVTPEPNHLDLLPELISRRGQVRLPESAQQWPGIRTQAVERLRREVFHLLDDVAQKQTLTQTGDWTHAGVDFLAWQGALDGMRQDVMQVATAGDADRAVLIGIGDRADESSRLAKQMREAVQGQNISTVGLEPRGAGRTAPHPSQQAILNREGCLVGLTPLMLMVQDLHHLMPRVEALPRVQGRSIYLYGKGEGALAMLYYALLHPVPAVKGVILEDLPRCHTETDHQILGIRTVMDLPQAVGLLAPMPVALINAAGNAFDWYWAQRAHARVSSLTTFNRVTHLSAAITALTAQ